MAKDAGHGPETDETTNRILDAALHCFAAGGVRKTTMNAIAAKAGVGVATVYRRYPQKLQLVQSVLIREAVQLVDNVDVAIAGAESFEDELVTGFVAFARELSARSFLRDMADTDIVSDAVAAMPGNGSPLLGLGRAYLANLIENWKNAGHLSTDLDANLIGEIYARLAHSLAMIPEGAIPLENPDRARDFARRYLLPLLHT